METKIKAVMSRTYGQLETKSSLFVLNGEELLFKCKALELPDNGNQHNVSCILEGVYDVEKLYWEAKHMWVFAVLNVPGRSGILIHIGNYAAGKKIDTEGCILPGM